MQRYSNQSGLAIITVLLIIALMVTLMGYLLEKQHLLTRRLGNQNIAEQGYQLATGVDQWAARLLFDDVDRSIDYWDEDWAKFGDPEEEVDDDSFSLDLTSQREEEPLPTIDFGVDGLSFKIEDMQARFNLNNLANEDDGLRRNQETIFLNLLSVLNIGELEERSELLGALTDWLDEGDFTTLNGYESPDYRSGNTPYYAADQKLTTLGELRYVRGFTDSIINKLRPYVTVLPVNNARININTTTSEVLTSLNSLRGAELDSSSVSLFLARRLEENFAGFPPSEIQRAQTAIIGAVPFNGGAINGGAIAGMLQTNSQFFEVTTQVNLGDFRFCSYSTLFRPSLGQDTGTSNTVTILNRHYSTICDEIVR